MGLLGFLVGADLIGIRVGAGVGSRSGVVGKLVGWRGSSSDPVGVLVGWAEVGRRVGLRVGILVDGKNVGATEGFLVVGDGVAFVGVCDEGFMVLGDGVGLLEYPFVTAPRARKVASILP